MSGYALGMIEVVGMVAAIEAADVCLKSANVRLLEVENATGALLTVKVYGDIGAVQAAVSAARVKAGQLGQVVAAHVIARPAKSLAPKLHIDQQAAPLNEATEFDSADIEQSAPEEINNTDFQTLPIDLNSEMNLEDTASTANQDVPSDNTFSEKQESHIAEATTRDVAPLLTMKEQEAPTIDRNVNRKAATCNLCNDPKCPRKKGQPAIDCIHNKKVNKS